MDDCWREVRERESRARQGRLELRLSEFENCSGVDEKGFRDGVEVRRGGGGAMKGMWRRKERAGEVEDGPG